MSFFKQYKKEPKGQKNTNGFCIGISEAEGEIAGSRINLSEVFEDYLDIKSKLGDERFIISGRKGSGKSAIAEHLIELGRVEPSLHSMVITKKMIDFEKLIQQDNSDSKLDSYALTRWMILTSFLGMLKDLEPVKSSHYHEHIDKFYNRNRGFIEINQNQLQELITTQKGEIQITYFKRLFSAIFNKELQIKQTQAPFYKLIPHLEEVIFELFQSKYINENSFTLIIDDLDINFKIADENQKKSLLDLFRMCREYNKKFLEKQISSKIILLLRNDIIKHYLSEADSGKLLKSYTIELNWYQNYVSEDESNLKKFILTRVKANFDRLEIPYNTSDLWSNFVSSEGFIDKTSFKYILDHTFYRPRDLILFFDGIDEKKYPLPLSKDNINELIGSFSKNLYVELRNELTAYFDDDTVKAVFDALRDISNNMRKIGTNSINYEELYNKLESISSSINAHELINELYDYSILGTISEKGDYRFKFREKMLETSTINGSDEFIINYGVRAYLRNTTKSF